MPRRLASPLIEQGDRALTRSVDSHLDFQRAQIGASCKERVHDVQNNKGSESFVFGAKQIELHILQFFPRDILDMRNKSEERFFVHPTCSCVSCSTEITRKCSRLSNNFS